jgi:hypothetical protein
MPDAAVETEPFRPPLPENAQEVLRTILDDGNTAFLADDDKTTLTGTPARPGRPVPCTVVNMLGLVSMRMIAGERELMLTTRRGRHFARHGTMAGFDDSQTDLVA